MKTVLITGTSQGIGLRAAQIFVENGFFVIGTSTSGACDYSHERFVCLPLDFTKPENIHNCISYIKEHDMSIDIFINNAAIAPEVDKKLPEEDDLRQTLEVNLIGPILLTNNLIPFISDFGRIIHVSSHLSLFYNQFDYKFRPSYRISKAGINMYSLVLQNNEELKRRGITACVLSPGKVKTKIARPDANRTIDDAARDYYDIALATDTNRYGILFGKDFVSWDKLSYRVPLMSRYDARAILIMFLFFGTIVGVFIGSALGYIPKPKESAGVVFEQPYDGTLLPP